jgi:hypothetical protein
VERGRNKWKEGKRKEGKRRRASGVDACTFFLAAFTASIFPLSSFLFQLIPDLLPGNADVLVGSSSSRKMPTRTSAFPDVFQLIPNSFQGIQ